jgi:hypothetical protein
MEDPGFRGTDGAKIGIHAVGLDGPSSSIREAYRKSDKNGTKAS